MLFIPLLHFLLISVTAFNQLSFSGGGAFGAVEIGILKRIVEMENKQYDLYTGISAGALNAGILSYFNNVKTGIQTSEKLYSTLRNRMVYDILPTTGLSVLNTDPLFKTLSKIINTMPEKPVVHTLIGATNLYSGNLDVYSFEDNDDYNKVLLLMASSAIPGLFPPIEYNDKLYADGGILSNELLQAETNSNYLNITYITPYDGYLFNDDSISSLQEMMKRTISIILKNYNNPLATMNQNCKINVGEINKYFVSSEHLKGYNILNFDKGEELIDIGYKYVQHKKYKIC